MKHSHEIIRATTPDLRKKGREFINQYHSYIKYSDRPSRKMYYNLYEDGNMVGVFALSSVFYKPKSVKEWMVNHDLKSNEIANNIVYCLARHKDKNAGSKFLALLRKDSSVWWHERYGDELKAFQTFILPPRSGAVYKADNWELIGETIGKSQFVRTIKPSEIHNFTKYEKQVFKSGEIRYLVRGFQDTEKKLIFMKLNVKRKTVNIGGFSF